MVIGSKPFAESYLLAEIFAQLLEARGYAVDRRLGLGATEITFQALRTDGIDLYPEYTGTGLVAILGADPVSDPDSVMRHVRNVFRDRWGVQWLAPLGFQNTYAIAVTRATADGYGLATLSDLSREAPNLVAGLSPDFLGRPDGLPGLRVAYDSMDFAATRSLLQAVKYEALVQGEVDVIDGYSTDGQIARYDLVVLDDDRDFFPAYQAVPLAGPGLFRDRPGVVAALTELAGMFDEAMMRRLNRRIEVEGHELPDVAEDALAALGLVAPSRRSTSAATEERAAPTPTPTPTPSTTPTTTTTTTTTQGRAPALLPYLWERKALLWSLTLRHLLLVGVSLLAAVLIAVPLGLALERVRGGAEGTIRAVGLLQTIPSIALLAFMIPLVGIGVIPALVALFLYSLYPILRNTYTGVRDASPEAVDAARALGMTAWQQLRWVRLPLAAPVIMAGIRTAAVITVGTATLAAFIGAGGLGDPIVSGLALSDTRMILSGAIPAALLALVVDGGLAAAERVVSPKGIGDAG
ncbi:MAG: glycine betaine ABC transporter substrate-binding protein [Longimicrobiales bacterium]|nr:glycine betaine ABC transporter substrate-binding protein [Longimicrobiales bacterium]